MPQEWEVSSMLFNAMVVQVFLYGVEVWGSTILLHAWNQIHNIQDLFLFIKLRRNFSIKKQILNVLPCHSPYKKRALANL